MLRVFSRNPAGALARLVITRFCSISQLVGLLCYRLAQLQGARCCCLPNLMRFHLRSFGQIAEVGNCGLGSLVAQFTYSRPRLAQNTYSGSQSSANLPGVLGKSRIAGTRGRATLAWELRPA